MVAWGTAIPATVGRPATATRHIALNEADDDGGHSGAVLYRDGLKNGPEVARIFQAS